MKSKHPVAPELEVSEWLNSDTAVSLANLRGRVVVLHTFQMLCPGCVSHGLPQAKRIRSVFPENDVAVIGLHTVFEHHEVVGAEALRVFVHEYRLEFPIGIDKGAEHSAVPLTMQTYALRGTPSLVLIDRQGRLRLSHFGPIDDLRVGALIGQLVNDSVEPTNDLEPGTTGTSAERCSID